MLTKRQFDGHIMCEPPNNNLSKFEGTLTWEGKSYPLDNECILLRGLYRNVSWLRGKTYVFQFLDQF